MAAGKRVTPAYDALNLALADVKGVDMSAVGLGCAKTL
jgi:hypothetical protein